MAIKIITDSTCDLPLTEQERLGIEILPLTLHFGETDYRDSYDITKKEFYNKLRAAKELPSTSQINPSAFLECYEKLGADGSELLVITLAANLSGTYQSACIAAEQYGKPVRVVDSGTATTAESLLVQKAAALRDAGASLDEIVDTLNALKSKLVIYACLNTLTYLQKGGRLSAASAVVGSLLNIKPVVKIQDGVVTVVHKARGMKAAVDWMCSHAIEQGIDFTLPIGFVHSDNPDGAAELKDYMAQHHPLGETLTLELGAVLGTHIGPGCTGLVVFH